MATIAVVAAVGFSLLMFVALANLVTFQYGRGAIRASLDEGARAGAVFGATANICEERIAASLGDLLGGEWGSGVEFRCSIGDELVVAEATGSFPGWLPMVPDFPFSFEAVATRELGT